EGGVAVFVPNDRRARTLADQLIKERQGPGKIAGEEKLPGAFEIVLRLGCHHAARHTRTGSGCGSLTAATRSRLRKLEKRLTSRCVLCFNRLALPPKRTKAS